MSTPIALQDCCALIFDLIQPCFHLNLFKKMPFKWDRQRRCIVKIATKLEEKR
jgi:hypothetical protein